MITFSLSLSYFTRPNSIYVAKDVTKHANSRETIGYNNYICKQAGFAPGGGGGRGEFLIVAYRGSLRPKGAPFYLFRSMKGSGNPLFRSVKKSREHSGFVIFRESAFPAVKGDEKF